MKIKGKTLTAAITRNGEDMVACIRIKAAERLIVGDTVSGLLDEVIAMVERQIVACKKDLQTIRKIQSLRGTCEGDFPGVRVEPHLLDELETCRLTEEKPSVKPTTKPTVKPTNLKLPELTHYDPDWIPTLHEVRKNLQGRMQRYVCNALPRRTVEESRMTGEILFYITESLEGDTTLITYLQRRGYPYIENEYATDLRVMWIEEIICFCELAKKG